MTSLDEASVLGLAAWGVVVQDGRTCYYLEVFLANKKMILEL